MIYGTCKKISKEKEWCSYELETEWYGAVYDVLAD